MRVNEENFIRKLKMQKESALEYVIDNYIGLVTSIVSKVLYNFNEEGCIEECVNDVFLSVWQNSRKFNGNNDDFKKWIAQVARFRAIDYYRKKIKKSEISFEEITLNSDISIEEDFISEENKNELLKIINSLEEPDNKIFVLKYFLGYKVEEIAEKLGLTLASVNNRIYRGKRKLKSKAIKANLEVI